MDDLLYSNPAYRLSRITEMLSAGVRQVKALTAGIAAQLLAGNTRRVAFTIGLASGTDLWLWFDNTVSTTLGWHLDSGQMPKTFSVSGDGPWVQQPIWALGGGAVIVVSLVETAIVDGEFDQSALTHNQGQANA